MFLLDQIKEGKESEKKRFEWAIKRAKKNAHIVQLTSDKQRNKAISFYKELGFKPTYEGMKLHI